MPLLKRPAGAAVRKRPSASADSSLIPAAAASPNSGGMFLLKRPAGAAVRERPSASADSTPASVPDAPPSSEKPDWLDEPDEDVQNEVFLVTASKLLHGDDADADPPLKDPAGISKRDFRLALQDSISNPMYEQTRGGRTASRTPELDVYVGVKESPHDGPEGEHHHAGLKFYKQQHRFLPFKLAMRHRHGIATHWSTSHTQLWSVIRYVHHPTTHKPVIDREPEVWTRDGRPLNLFEKSQKPFQAQAWKADRERRASEPLDQQTHKNAERFTKLDFNAVVLAARLLTPNAVLEYIQEEGSSAMQLWVANRQRKLKELIREAQDWGEARQAAAAESETDWALIGRLAKNTCPCWEVGCLWWIV